MMASALADKAYLAPTPRAVLLMGAGVPLTLALGFVAPTLWPFGAAWIALMAGLLLLDVVLGAGLSDLDLRPDLPDTLYVGEETALDIHVHFTRNAPKQLELRLDTDHVLRVRPVQDRIALSAPDSIARFSLQARERGEAAISRIWARWSGPLGLVARARGVQTGQTIPVLINMAAIQQAAISLFSRNHIHGHKRQRDKGEGTEFDSLREFATGMDHRKIDWKASARHNSLLAKEFRTERNHNIMIVLDTGHAMRAPILGLPRLDHALQAGLLLGFAGLRTGDRVGFFAFDAEPVLHVRPLQHAGSFGVLQRMTAGLTYSTRETNFTLGLSRLQQSLDRRTLIVMFTDFTDTVSAELMLENLGRLQRDHVVLFVALADMELQEMIRKNPASSDDMTQAVIAAGMLREREVVMHRLARLGINVLETEPAKLHGDLISRYLAIKAEGML